MNRRIWIVSVLTCGSFGWDVSLWFESHKRPVLDELLKRLQKTETTNQAADDLFKLGRRNSEARRYLSRHLPPIIEKGPEGSADNSAPWFNVVRLCGRLKLTEASAALAKWIDVQTGGTVTLGQVARLEYNPAAKALVEIGDPAVPEVAGRLQADHLNSRWTATFVLAKIGSPAARKALKDHLARENDKELRVHIKGLTDAKP